MYACKIKETANGSRRSACSKTRQEVEVLAQRSFAEHVQVDEQTRASQNGQNQAKRETDEEKAALKEVPNLRKRRVAFVLHHGDDFFQWFCADFARSGERMVEHVNQKQD
jgi:collagenase-like PrtC family protease